MAKILKAIPLVTVVGAFIVAGLDAYTEAKFNSSIVTAIIYAGLGSTAAVGFSKYWKKQ